MYCQMWTDNFFAMAETKVIPDKAVKEITALFHHVPKKSATCIEALKIIQNHNRWVSDDAVKELAVLLEMSPDEIDGVATFYNIIFRQPVGRHIIHLCNSVSCYILGYEKIEDHIKNKLKVGFGETTPDGRFTFLPIPCLGTCDHGPAMIIDEDLHRDLTAEKVDEILEKYQ